MTKILFDSLVHVHYGQAYVEPEADRGFDMKEAFHGQRNGLCGAAVPECLFLITGLHTGSVQLRVELHEGVPADLEDWDEIVEVPFLVTGPVVLRQWAGEAEYPLQLPEGQYRARYAANDMDAGHEADTARKGPDSYLLQFWPTATQAPDAVIKQSSKSAEYWHTRDMTKKRPTLTPVQQAAQVDMLRQSTIDQLKATFGRSLTDEEKQCVVVKVKDGRGDSYLAPPLSETVKEWYENRKGGTEH